jgi:hypothetical protein
MSNAGALGRGGSNVQGSKFNPFEKRETLGSKLISLDLDLSETWNIGTLEP